MKVLMFGWEFPPHISGGLGTACFGLTEAMSLESIDIVFVVPKLFGDEPSDGLNMIGAGDVVVSTQSKSYKKYQQNLKTIMVNSLLSPYINPSLYSERYILGTTRSLNNGSTKLGFSGSYGGDLLAEVERYALVGEEIAKQNDFDIIHCHDWLTYKAGIAAKKVSGKPLVVHVHATEFDRSGHHVNQMVYDLERTGMEEADFVITVSDFTASIVRERYGISVDKIKTVHNGVHFQTTPKKENDNIEIKKEHVVTFLGRITSQKGPSYFIDAAAKILEVDKSFRFVMAGSGDLLDQMVRKVDDLNLSPYFHFAGFLEGEEVKKVYAQSDVFVMPSVSEPFGIVPLEAIRQGVPVIISKQSGVSEVLQHAIKVDFWEVDELADAIYGLVKYPSISSVMKRNASEEVAKISWDKAAQKVKKVYESLIH